MTRDPAEYQRLTDAELAELERLVEIGTKFHRTLAPVGVNPFTLRHAILDILAARTQVEQLTKRVAELEAEKLKTKQE